MISIGFTAAAHGYYNRFNYLSSLSLPCFFLSANLTRIFSDNDNQMRGWRRRSPLLLYYDYHSYADLFILKDVLTKFTHF